MTRTVSVHAVPFSLAALLSLCAVSAHATPAKVAPDPLATGNTTFWDGMTIATTKVQSDDACDVLGPCPTWSLNLKAGGKRLRVGIDTPRRSDTFVVEILDASGALLASDATSNKFNAEAMLADPKPGTYTIRVRPEDVTNATFRLRAKLEDRMIPEERTLPAGHVALLPNLRAVPPFEFTFTAPANPANGAYPPDTVNPPLDVFGYHPVSCTADEAAPVEAGGAAAVKCLRFTSGPMNLGPGLYDMRFKMIEDTAAGKAAPNSSEAFSRVVVGPMEQVIYYSDGTNEHVSAGTYSFHPVHAHFHDDYVLGFELYRVIDAQKGVIEHAGAGTKSGFCPADQLFAEWWKFYQGGGQPGGDTVAGNCFNAKDGVIGLSLGWGDVYRWQRPGMYVEFADQPNGRYVVQSIVDPKNDVREADDSDNVSYAYVQVDGDRIQLLERGWGKSPWDPKKTVFAGDGPAQHDPVAGDEIEVTKTANIDVAEGSGLAMGGALAPGFLLLLGAAALRRREPSCRP